MKKVIIILLLSLSVLSCSTRITVQSVDTGRVERINEAHRVTKLGDTIVLRISTNGYGSSFYGKYVGKLPEPITVGGISISYIKSVRIK
tara:strand:+ start:28064 stop:28330 length:267 start_codon:yes stop_codon:yes gene_type:complete